MLKSLYARIVFRLIRPALVHLEHEEIRARGFVMESQPRVPPLDCQLRGPDLPAASDIHRAASAIAASAPSYRPGEQKEVCVCPAGIPVRAAYFWGPRIESPGAVALSFELPTTEPELWLPAGDERDAKVLVNVHEPAIGYLRLVLVGLATPTAGRYVVAELRSADSPPPFLSPRRQVFPAPWLGRYVKRSVGEIAPPLEEWIAPRGR